VDSGSRSNFLYATAGLIPCLCPIQTSVGGAAIVDDGWRRPSPPPGQCKFASRCPHVMPKCLEHLPPELKLTRINMPPATCKEPVGVTPGNEGIKAGDGMTRGRKLRSIPLKTAAERRDLCCPRRHTSSKPPKFSLISPPISWLAYTPVQNSQHLRDCSAGTGDGVSRKSPVTPDISARVLRPALRIFPDGAVTVLWRCSRFVNLCPRPMAAAFGAVQPSAYLRPGIVRRSSASYSSTSVALPRNGQMLSRRIPF